MPITQSHFGNDTHGNDVLRYRLDGTSGLSAEIMTHGATLIALRTPDRHGTLADVTLGFATLEPYLGLHPFFGSTVGRYANRIAGGSFTLNGIHYQLACNHGTNHLHGGQGGFHTRAWSARIHADGDEPAVELSYTSPAGEEGYPGTLHVSVTYTVTHRNELRIDYHAESDAPTILNLTNHAYFNLAGRGSILDHEVELRAAAFLPTDAGSIPLGAPQPVAGTPMDFTTPQTIGARIDVADEQLRIGKGYDHCWILDKPAGALALAARVADPKSGRIMEVETTEPGVQFYTANQLDGQFVGRDGLVYQPRAGLCLETQHLPDSPNRPEYPSTVLRPGESYRQTTIYRFLIAENG
ncbi:MAG TPA: aldose epimerase family protein [Roseiflexaceae bacterium]|nr:aldose epimerase family protein [Roseiflexaceae bacterium]HMP40905.1 aldose epimerase family protein [Roseiflexaceae bacterium]